MKLIGTKLFEAMYLKHAGSYVATIRRDESRFGAEASKVLCYHDSLIISSYPEGR